MRFKPLPVQVPPEDPFKEDLLSRKQNAEVLTDFVASLAEPFVLAIDSPWGTGKTTFLRMWLQHLRNQGFHCLYFNAWENDFTESPIISLIGEVGAEIEAAKLGDKDNKVTEIYQKTKKAGAALLRAATPMAIKIVTSGLVDLSGIKEGDIAKFAEEIAKKEIEKYQADKKTIHHFREDLSKLVSVPAGAEGGQPKPVVFVVDELDRCRPPYAVELLEKVKHLFSVDGLVFVLAIDREQLGESVKTMYGSGMRADGYLRRFIDLEYQLPEPTPEGFVRAQFYRLGIDQAFKAARSGDQERLEEALPPLFTLFGFSLRTQEQCFTQIGLIIRTTPPGHYLFAYLLSVLLCLRTANRPLYLKYCRGQAAPEEVLNYLRTLTGGRKFVDSHSGLITEAFLIAGIRDEQERSVAMKTCLDLANSQGADKSKKDRARAISQVFQNLNLQHHLGDVTGYLFRKLELMHRFASPPA